MRRAAVVFALVVSMAIAFAGWLVSTTGGARWLAERLAVQAAFVDGSLLSGLTLTKFEWRDDQTEVVVHDVRSRWQPECFLSLSWCVSHLSVGSVDVRLTGTAEAPAAIDVPSLPLDVRFDDLRTGPVRVTRDGTPFIIDSVTARWSIVANVVSIERLDVRRPDGSIAASGVAQLTDEQTVDARLQLQLNDAALPGAGSIDLGLAGSIPALVFSGDVRSSGMGVEIKGRLEPLLATPRFSLTASAARLALPTDDPPAELRDVTVSTQGSFESYEYDARGRLSSGDFGAAAVSLRGTGSVGALIVERLEVNHELFEVRTAGQLSFEDMLWQGEIELVRFDASRWLADLRQPLTGTARTMVRPTETDWLVELDSLQLNAVVDERHVRLSGSVSAISDGRFQLPGLLLTIDENRIDLAGRGQYDLDNGELAYAIESSWQRLAFSQGTQQFTLRDGDLKATGSNQSYDLTVGTTLGGANLPSAAINAHVQGDQRKLSLEKLSVATLAGQVDATGQLEFGEPMHWAARVDFSDIDPSRQWPEMSGNLHGAVIADGLLGTETSIAVRQLGVDGVLRGAPFKLAGAGRADAGGQLHIDTLELRSQGNRLSVAGTKLDEWALQGELQLGDLSTLLPVTGAVRGGFSITGATESPTLGIQLNARDVKTGGVSVGALEITGSIKAFGQRESTLEVKATAIQVGETTASSATVAVAGTRDSHAIDANLISEPASVDVRMDGRVTETFDWHGRVARARAELKTGGWATVEPFALSWSNTARSVHVAAHCWQQAKARLCVSEPADLGASGALSVQLIEFDVASIAPLLPERTTASGQLGATADVRWSNGASPTARVEAVVHDGIVSRALDQNGEPVNVRFSEFALDAEVGAEQTGIELRLDAYEMGRLSARIEFDAGDRALAGEFSLTGFNLAVLAPFFAELSTMSGIADANGTISGSLARPIMTGRVEARDIALATPELPVAVRAGHLVVNIDGTSAKFVASADIEAGGNVNLTGDAQWSEETWQMSAHLTGEEIAVRHPPLFSLKATPDLKLRLAPRVLSVSGDLLIPWARIEIQSIPQGVTQVSRDVVIVDAEAAPEAEAWQIETRVNIILGDDVLVSGQGVEAKLLGDLQFAQLGANPAVANGEIFIADGNYSAYGQKLTITEGRFLFVGSLQPDVTLTAVRTVGSVTAGIQVRGTLRRPQTELFATPPQTETNTLSYIVLGRPMNSENPQDGQVLTRAALAIGLSGGGRSLATQVADQFGIKDFEIDANDDPTAGTQVVLRGRISPNLSVRYGVSVLTPDNVLTLRYDLSERLYVEMAQGLENALDFFYSFSF